jgi:hypothetical protein
VYKIAKSIPSILTLKKWVWLFQGFMYEGYGSAMITDPEVTLAWLLNSMIMVAGGSGNQFPFRNFAVVPI